MTRLSSHHLWAQEEKEEQEDQEAEEEEEEEQKREFALLVNWRKKRVI